ncbi:uncharacterized protein LOC143040282 [Oratosquilla oratoria]|uniref:uncharacterized protein LOC143040282 n=1 Tax=Oratosquilla oratoria TaxID=337810 RepID=UPI003F75BA83
MPRQCLLCRSFQTPKTTVFAFPTSCHQRAAWVAAVQASKPSFSLVQISTRGRQNQVGICEHHFYPHEIFRGQKKRLHRESVPSVFKCTDDCNQKDISENTTADVVDISYENKDSLETYNKNFQHKQVETQDILDSSDFHDGPGMGNKCEDSLNNVIGGVEYGVMHYTENSEMKVCMVGQMTCLVCGNVDSEFTNHNKLEDDFGMVYSILANIVSKPKKQLKVYHHQVCMRCFKLILEVSELEELIKEKKNKIKIMFESTANQVVTKQGSVGNKTRNDKNVTTNLECHNTINLESQNASNFEHQKEESKSKALEKPEVLEGIRKSSRATKGSSRKSYDCPSCDVVLNNYTQWLAHLKTHRATVVDKLPKQNHRETGKTVNRKRSKGKGLYECDMCQMAFFCKQSLSQHLALTHKGMDCSVCGRYLTTKARLDIHLQKFHGIGEEKCKSIACPDCDKSFSTKAGLRYHQNVVHRLGKKYECDQCKKEFYYHVPYRSHMLFAHGEKKVVCETCGDLFFTVAKLNIHINAVHRNAQTWLCKDCNQKFTTNASYRHHMNIKHQEAKHKCCNCSASFRKKASLMRHLWIHSIFLCGICGLRFTTTDTFRMHMLEKHDRVVQCKPRQKEGQLQVEMKPESHACHDPQQSLLHQSQLDSKDKLTSIVINDILINSDSYDNANLQKFSVAPEKLPDNVLQESNTELQDDDEDLKVKSLCMMDSGQDEEEDLTAVDHMQFGSVETLEINTSHDGVEMSQGVPLINVQILSDMEMSQSDTLGDLKTSMMAIGEENHLSSGLEVHHHEPHLIVEAQNEHHNQHLLQGHSSSHGNLISDCKTRTTHTGLMPDSHEQHSHMLDDTSESQQLIADSESQDLIMQHESHNSLLQHEAHSTLMSDSHSSMIQHDPPEHLMEHEAHVSMLQHDTHDHLISSNKTSKHLTDPKKQEQVHPSGSAESLMPDGSHVHIGHGQREPNIHVIKEYGDQRNSEEHHLKITIGDRLMANDKTVISETTTEATKVIEVGKVSNCNDVLNNSKVICSTKVINVHQSFQDVNSSLPTTSQEPSISLETNSEQLGNIPSIISAVKVPDDSDWALETQHLGNHSREMSINPQPLASHRVASSPSCQMDSLMSGEQLDGHSIMATSTAELDSQMVIEQHMEKIRGVIQMDKIEHVLDGGKIERVVDVEKIEENVDKINRVGGVEKMDGVELEPFQVSLENKGGTQYQYVMYIPDPTADLEGS